MDQTHKLLAQGLSEGFASTTTSTRKIVDRAGFPFETNHVTIDKDEYHDEWTGTVRAGGQEVAAVGTKKITRVYAGGVVALEILEALGITKKEVITFLKKIILEHSEEIRLADNAEFRAGDWHYLYIVLDHNELLGLITGKEEIYYKEHLVFGHNFIISPVEG